MNGRSAYSFGSSAWTPAVKALIIANAALFIAQELLPDRLTNYLLYWLGLSPYLVMHKGAVWQLVTYMFLHGDLLHIAFNMFALWMFGSQLERSWGRNEFLKYYFITGIGAGIINVAVTPNSPIPIIGASGAIFGLLLAYGVLFPNNLILVYFILPIKAKYFVMIFAVIEFLMAKSYALDGVAHFAHLGGMAVGFAYLKGMPFLRRYFWRMQQDHRELQDAKRAHYEAERLRNLQEIHAEIDYLLDRINRIGYENLTSEEKQRLEEASRLLRLHEQKTEDLN